MDETIALMWIELRQAIEDESWPEIQAQEMRLAFYAGASAILMTHADHNKLWLEAKAFRDQLAAKHKEEK